VECLRLDGVPFVDWILVLTKVRVKLERVVSV